MKNEWKSIKENMVVFKSLPQYYRKEVLDIKNNTVRQFKNKANRNKKVLDSYLNGDIGILFLEMHNKKRYEEEAFGRTVRDVTKFGDIYIITWKPEAD